MPPDDPDRSSRETPSIARADPERIAAYVRELAAARPDAVSQQVPLRNLTTLRVGGPALGVCRVRTAADAIQFLDYARCRDVPLAILGGGSNVFAQDNGFTGLILRPEIDEFAVDGDIVTAGAGLALDAVVARTLDRGLTGLAFASGIPGTIGGAVVGNAGCFGHEIGEFLVAATLLRADGRLETVGPEACGFGYRRSELQTSADLLLAVRLRLPRADVAAARRERAERLAERRRRHPVLEPCAGSWFKNLPSAAPGGRRRAAGELLDEAGAKSLRVGDAGVFPLHANIVVNLGRATSADVRALVELMRDAVRRRFGVRLAEEVRTLGPAGFAPPDDPAAATSANGPFVRPSG